MRNNIVACLHLYDLLQYDKVQVDAFEMDGIVDVIVTQQGKDMYVEVLSIKGKKISGTTVKRNHITLDINANPMTYSGLLVKKFIEAVKQEAIKQAKTVSEQYWEYKQLTNK